MGLISDFTHNKVYFLNEDAKLYEISIFQLLSIAENIDKDTLKFIHRKYPNQGCDFTGWKPKRNYDQLSSNDQNTSDS